MIADREFQNYEDILYFDEPEIVKKDVVMDKIYEILEQEKTYDILPDYDLRDIKISQDVLEVYKTIFWGITALASTLLWLYFFLT